MLLPNPHRCVDSSIMLQAVSVVLLLLLIEPVKSVFTAIVLRIYFHKTYLFFSF